MRSWMPRLTPALLALALAVLAAALPSAAVAGTGPCLPDQANPSCQIWSGKVTSVKDGDTLDVDIAGDGTRKARRVRLTGIQAMEQRVYSSRASRRRGDCHALEATARFERLVRAGRGAVRLSARRAESRTGSRLRRSVAVRIGGRWRDVGSTLVAEGHALWLPNGVEYAWNDTYRRLAQQAADAARGLWHPQSCGRGPSEQAKLRLGLQWDAQGIDYLNVNGERITLANLDPTTEVPLGGWSVRDSALRRYTFPSWARIPAGGRIDVHVGAGTSTPGSLFWGLRAPVFENATRDARAMGDGAYLFDPDGDLRAWSMYS